MIDYKELYLELFRGTERAIRVLEQAQRKCEELYMEAEDGPNLVLLEEAKASLIKTDTDKIE